MSDDTYPWNTENLDAQDVRTFDGKIQKSNFELVSQFENLNRVWSSLLSFFHQVYLHMSKA